MADLTKNLERKVELNERISETQYDVLHPVTKAEYVIENEDQKFVSQEQIDAWNQVVENETDKLTWKGEHIIGTTYAKNDVVLHNGKYYISKIDNNTGNVPTDTEDSDSYWYNLNLEAYTATRADTIKVETATGASDAPVLLQGTGTTYKKVGSDSKVTYNATSGEFKVGTGITLNANTGEITGTIKGLVDGTATNATNAEIAQKYVEYNYDEEGNRGEASGETPYISDAIKDLTDKVEVLVGGGTTLTNPITITKDGENAVIFDGSKAVTIDIKQTYNYTPEDIDGLLDANDKIKEVWLPDTILGQLSYQGTWDPSVAGSVTPVKGDYYIATANGRYYPDGTELAADAEAFETGDWAVYNGTSWDKVDNTDAVRTVNGQIGNVETYKGTWAAETKYYAGDIVVYNGNLYLCKATHTSATDWAETNWHIFGRVYTGDDIITVNGSTISHKQFTATGETTTKTLASGDSFNVPVLTRDQYGHVEKIDIQKISLGNDFVDTVRPVAINGTEVLTKTDKAKTLDINSGNKIAVSYGNDKVSIDHEATGNGELDLTVSSTNLTLAAGGKFQVPSINVDAYGHITAGEMKEFTMAASPITHAHFNVVDENGIQNIRAYTAAEATSTWLADTANKGKFYWGDADTLRVNSKFGATELYQGTNKVVDSTIKINGGHTWVPSKVTGTVVEQDLVGTYDADTGVLTMADTGVTEGVYSAVRVNSKGLVAAGGQIVEFGTEVNAGPSDNLAVGGLFFRKLA